MGFQCSGSVSQRGQSSLLPLWFMHSNMFDMIVLDPLIGTMSEAVIIFSAMRTSFKRATLVRGRLDRINTSCMKTSFSRGVEYVHGFVSCNVA